LGRVTGRSINGSANAATWSYDAMSRVTSIANVLGTFTPTYVDQGAGGGDKGTTRLASVAYPNGQVTNYSYYSTTYDERLQEISNLNPSGANLSQFNYSYDSKGQILSWERQAGSNPATTYTNAYDPAGQLRSAVLANSSTTLNQFYYNYDATGNRTSEQIGANVTQATPNNVNQISSLSSGGPTRFQGAISQPGTVTVNGHAAFQSTSTNFIANPVLSGGTNTVAVVATNGNGAAQTNNYQVVIPSTATITPTYDFDGNMTNNGNGQQYVWDAENRLICIKYTGGATSNFTYDAMGQRVGIVEKNSSGTVTSTKNIIWADGQMTEVRDATGTNVTNRFYPQGEQISGTNYYYTRDHLGSVREMTDSTGTVQAQYDYDPYGNATLVAGTNLADFQYAGMYAHQTSGLSLTLFRAYDPNTGRWLSRDPLGEGWDATLYSYVGNDPVGAIDPLGLWEVQVTADLGVGVSINFGSNGGVSNFGITAGVGAGASASFTPFNTSQFNSNSISVVSSASIGIGGLSTRVNSSAGYSFGDCNGNNSGLKLSVGGQIGSNSIAGPGRIAGSVSVNPSTGQVSTSSSGLISQGASAILGVNTNYSW
jgi:RHS repeat-associated protein